ncbi:MAG TPA: CidA/LrgA family protein [Geopsychrobacteraceae bacterium]|nr:CidA/LrgA family protein [Geopsychrobacteraceae bacterium]
MLQGLVFLLVFQFLGEVLSDFLGLPLPGNVLGMALLLLALTLGVVKEESLREAADLLLSYMALFFVPAGVGVMLYFDLISQQWMPIVVGTVFSTFAVIAVTGWTEKWLDQAESDDE